MKEKNKRPVRVKGAFAANFLPQVIIGLLSFVFFAVLCAGTLRSYAKARSLQKLGEAAGIVADCFEPLASALDTFSHLAAQSQDELVLGAALDSFAKNIPDAERFYYATVRSRRSGGFYLDSSGWKPVGSWEAYDEDWFNTFLEGGGETDFLPPEDGLESFLFTFGKAVVRANRIIGVTAADISLEPLIARLGAVKITEHSAVYVVDSDGNFITHPDVSKLMNANYFAETGLSVNPDDWLTDTPKVFFIGKNYYCAQAVPHSPWFVIAEGQLADFVVSPAKQFLVLLAVILVLALLGANRNSRSVLRYRTQEGQLTKKLCGKVSALSNAAKQTVSDAQEQAEKLKGLLDTPEDGNAFFERNSAKAKDAARVSEKNAVKAAEAVTAADQNQALLAQLRAADKNTAAGIKTLSEAVAGLQDIELLLDGLTDRAKTIAFNAALESADAEHPERDFRTVASEIRRLSDGISAGTERIKEKIAGIQKSSGHMVLAARSGSEKISAGCDGAPELNEVFAKIQAVVQDAAAPVQRITEVLRQQSKSAGQVQSAFRQSAAGTEKFMVASEQVAFSAEDVRLVSEELDKQLSASQKEVNHG